mgnify:CR=1 FL=1
MSSAKAAAAVRSAEIGTTFNILSNQRELETSQEAEEAMSQRMLKTVQTNGSDLKKAFSAILDFAKGELGMDTSKMEPQDLIGLALAFDIQTGDPAFEDAKKTSQEGLMKLVNANNALALHDYLEVLPWLSYGGQVMNKFSNHIAKFMGKNYVPIRPTNGWFRGVDYENAAIKNEARDVIGFAKGNKQWRSPNAVWNDILNNYRTGINYAAIHGMQPRIGKLAEEYADALMTARNSFIDRLAGYFMAHDAKRLGLQ